MRLWNLVSVWLLHGMLWCFRALAQAYLIMPIGVIDRCRSTGRIYRLGSKLVGSTPEQFGEFLRAEITKWAKVIEAAGITAD